MKAIRVALFAPLALAGCASLPVRTDYAPQMPFAELRTYSWLDRDADAGGDPALNSALLVKRIRSAIDRALATRGYQKVTSGSSDFWIRSRVFTEPKATVDRPSGYGGSYGSSVVPEFVWGTLVVDIFDARTNELIWRGWAEDALDDNPKPEKVQMYVSEAVGKILERFPLVASGSGWLVT